MMAMISIMAAGCAVSVALIAAMLRSGHVGPMDAPNTRSLHGTPIPRSGGLGVLAALALGIFVSQHFVLGVLLASVAMISWMDDHHNLPAGLRFAVHFLMAAMLAWWNMLPNWGLPLTVLMIVGVVWLTNLFNFMDGANGLAGGMALIGFSTLGLAAWSGGAPGMAQLALSAAGGALGFLFFNFHPARIFMGDVGSISLGFLSGAAGLYGVRAGLWPICFVLLVFSPFVVDATVTLLRRLLRGERIWEAHREHYYQRLIQSGWTHRRTAIAYYTFMLAAALSALLLLNGSTRAWVVALTAWTLVYLALAIAIDRRWQRHLHTKKT